jgi:hypothetical protein
MKKQIITTTLSLMFSLTALAQPVCVMTGDCIEYKGEIVDIRSPSKRAVDSVTKNGYSVSEYSVRDYSIPDEHLPQLTKHEYSRIVGKEGTRYFIPIELRDSDAMVLATALSLGVVVFANDKEIMNFVQDTKVEKLQPVVDFGNFMGRGGVFSVAAGAYFMGAVMKNGKLKKIGLFAVVPGLATQLVTEAFKKTFTRGRPNKHDSPYDFFEGEGNYSFFSGHVSGAFSIATVVAEIYKDKPVVPYLAYGAAALTAYARMHDKKHWGSDVLLGAIAGHLITKIFIRTMEATERSGSGLSVMPEFGMDHMGRTYGNVRVSWTPSNNNVKLKCDEYGLQGQDLVRACAEEIFLYGNF